MQTHTHTQSFASITVSLKYCVCMCVCVCSGSAGTFGTNSSSEFRVDGKVNGALRAEMLPGRDRLNGQ